MFVKICGITNEEDALLAVALGADAVGFIFAPSPRWVPVGKVYDITRRLPPEILTVGVFRDEHPQRVIETVDRAGLKAAQLHGHETPDDVAEVMKSVRTVIKAVSAGTTDAARADRFPTDLVLVDAPAPGSGRVFDWSLLGEVPVGPRLILAGGLTPENVAAGIAAARPWGVDVSSGVESSPGHKDPVKLRRFIAAAREAAPPGDDDADAGPAGRAPYDWMDD
ncbi:MAG: phosphoribosylanthranilate isomerase [Acidimicrobiales bacterium]